MYCGEHHENFTYKIFKESTTHILLIESGIKHVKSNKSETIYSEASFFSKNLLDTHCHFARRQKQGYSPYSL